MDIVPLFGLGTFRLKDGAAKKSVSMALELGYRAIDTAQIYENEAEVGEAVESSGVNRSDLFITTKIWVSNFKKDRLRASLEESLAKLKTSYADLVLIHWPSPNNETPMSEYLPALIEAKEAGLTKHIGVSNFTIEMVKEAVSIAGKGGIATNQIELSPWLQNRKAQKFAAENGFQITSYMTLSYKKYLDDPTIARIARDRGADSAAVILSWAMSKKISVIPSSVNRDHLKSNLESVSLRLSEEDIAAIDGLDSGRRECDPRGLAPKWDD